MVTIGNVIIHGESSSCSFSDQETIEIITSLEKKHDFDVSRLSRELFVNKIAPSFLRSGASIISTVILPERNIYSYEIKVDDVGGFKNDMKKILDCVA